MSNEYKDWIWDVQQEILIEQGLMDKIEEMCEMPYSDRRYAHGWKDGQKVIYAVWCNDDGAWEYVRIS